MLYAVGTDIYGMIEVRDLPQWQDPIAWTAAMDLGLLYSGRSYDAFSCLFGVRDFAGFRPVAADRGLPADAAEPTRRAAGELENDIRSPTWIGWDEIRRIDWDEPAEHTDSRLHRYERGADGEWVMHSKSGWSREAFEVRGVPVPPAGTAPEIHPEGSVWTRGDVQFRAVRLTRRDAVPEDGEWGPVWEVMAVLGRLHGDANCRLVVWFD
jgi:hypothetical protein